jgi:hypothetical protein
VWQYTGGAPLTGGHRSHWSAVGPPDDQARPDDGDRAWAAPESTTAIESPPTPDAGPTRPTTAAAPGVDGEVRLPVPLRPMSWGDLLDGGFNVLRARPRIVLGLAAVFVVPVQVIVAYFNRNALEDLNTLVDQTLSNAGARPEGGVGNPWASIFGTVGTSLGQALIGASLALLVVAWYSGEQPDGREVLRRLKPRFWSLSGAWLVIHLLEVAGWFTLGIATLVVMTLYLVAAPAIAVEGLGPFKGMSRASSLASPRFWPVLGFAVLSGIVASVLGQVLGLLPQILGLVLGPDFGWIALAVGAIITQMVSATVVGASTALLYLDLRIRREGMDVAWAADRVFPA